MKYYQVVLLFLFTSALNGSQSQEQNASPTKPATRAEMNERIKGIARGIVDKWKAEGLKITRDNVQGWLGTLEKSKKSAQQQTAKPADNTEKFGKHFPQVRDSLVDTFSKIGKVKCPDCNKSPNQLEKPTVNETPKLEQLSLEELKAKQKAIQQFAQMSKIAKVDKPKLEELSLDELKEKQKVIQQFPQMSKTVKGEQPKENENVKLDQMSVEQLIQKQKAIQQFAQMGKMAKLVSNLNKLTTPREEL